MLQRSPARPPRARAPWVLAAVALLAAGAAWHHRPRPEPLHAAYAALESTGLALEAYRAREGEYPAQLSDLLAQDLDALPGDPFDPAGGPLRYSAPAANPDGRLLYSLGPDRVDQRGMPRDPLTREGDLTLPVR